NIVASPRGARSAAIAVANAFVDAYRQTGATIDVGANAVPAFMAGTNQIGFYAYGAGSKINVAAQHLSVDTDDSTLFRVAGG
ncbi:hypothetical protein NO136_19920, partial [Clostridioides difficile]|nr:hypothetical protein [Clostridioides difficile]